MKHIKSFLPLLFAPLLTACLGDEPNNIAYVTAIGMDRSDIGYLYTIQFAQPTKISGGSEEGGGSVGDIVDNIAVEAPTLYSAINVADTIISKDLSLSHAKVFVVAEDIARRGLGELNDVIARNNDISPDIYISITDNAGEYLESVMPSIELNPVKYYQLTYENKNGSAIPQNNAHDFYSACVSGSKDALLPLAGIAGAEDETAEAQPEKQKSIENEKQENAEINTGGFDNGTRNYFAGETGKKIKNKSEVLGAAVFKGDRLIGKIGSTETELHNILMNHFVTMNLSFFTDDGQLTLKVSEKSFPEYVIDKDDKTADIYLTLQCELLSVPDKHPSRLAGIEKTVADAVNSSAEQFAEKMYRDMGADVLGIRGRLKSKFLTLGEYERYCAGFDPAEWRFFVHSDVDIRRTGMTYYE